LFICCSFSEVPKVEHLGIDKVRTRVKYKVAQDNIIFSILINDISMLILRTLVKKKRTRNIFEAKVKNHFITG
jgi:hypothetical protein